MQAGESQTVDLAPLPDARGQRPAADRGRAEQLTDLDVQISSSGSSVTITHRAQASRAGPVPRGHERRPRQTPTRTARSRAGSRSRSSTCPTRRAPGAPARPCDCQEVGLDWRAPQTNGAPIDYYEVQASSAARPSAAASTSCDITGLTTARRTRSRSAPTTPSAVSAWSGSSGGATPDKPSPASSVAIELVRVGDGTLSIDWKPTSQGSAVNRLLGRSSLGGRRQTATPPRRPSPGWTTT